MAWGNLWMVQEVVDLVSKKKPEFVFLMETMVDGSHAERLRVKLGFEGCFAVDSERQRGGMCFLGAKNNCARLIKYSHNHIVLKVSLSNRPLWRLTCYYGYPQRDMRRVAWDFIRSLRGVTDLPWVVLGDFNDLLMQTDKRGRLPHPDGLIEGFGEALDDCGLMTLPMIGYPFTWERGRGTARWVEERLDRVAANMDRLEEYDRARLFNIRTNSSDHNALFLDICGMVHVPRSRGFRFENAWLLDGGCREVVEREWASTARLDVCGRGMRRCGGDRYHRYGKRIEGIQKEMNALRGGRDPVSLAYEVAVSLLLWLGLGSLMSSWNVILKLKDDNGVWRESSALDSVVTSYYKHIFASGGSPGVFNVDTMRSCVTRVQNEDLLRPFEPDEVRNALFSMGKDKSPGPDGMNPGFYQSFWDVIGKDVTDIVLHCLSEKSFPANLNDANTVLIPKKCSPVSVSNLRPIALCNVLLISDNILIAYEVGHYLRRKQLGQVGWAALKLDMAKAYDRMEWPFVRQMMIGLGFDDKWVQLDSQAKGLLHGCRVARGAPSISHLFFADDSLLFFKANLQEALEVKKCLGIYESFSGQAVNFQKSSITFSRNTVVEDRDLVADALGVGQADDFGKYLGLPSVVGRNRKAVFAYVEQKLKQKFGSWNKRLLSRAGKEVLLKSVAQAMPTYTMTIYLLHKTLFNALERLMNRYWWGQKCSEGSIHWMSWDRMCVPKKFGGLGFKRLHEFNLVFLAIQGWRLLTNPGSLMAWVFKARYYPTTTFYEASMGGNPSYAWRSIFAGQALLRSGCRRRIGNGRTTRVWSHPWLPDAHDPYVGPIQPGLNQDLLVSNLIDNSTNGWKDDFIQQHFAPRDVLLIK
ncbi:PREDICTED: uncharacterized protein LOC109159529 [Ipomoea nil]|uniref:uncharacterized protein LOC109159529 n=1 Tax=Ipomoea nil TaxID=35883 RepID=UPI000901B911|nr:PREDICTED: uncharacterized protein LOC109159529 [Ipomoea nil]